MKKRISLMMLLMTLCGCSIDLTYYGVDIITDFHVEATVYDKMTGEPLEDVTVEDIFPSSGLMGGSRPYFLGLTDEAGYIEAVYDIWWSPARPFTLWELLGFVNESVDIRFSKDGYTTKTVTWEYHDIHFANVKLGDVYLEPVS